MAHHEAMFLGIGVLGCAVSFCVREPSTSVLLAWHDVLRSIHGGQFVGTGLQVSDSSASPGFVGCSVAEYLSLPDFSFNSLDLKRIVPKFATRS